MEMGMRSGMRMKQDRKRDEVGMMMELGMQ